MEINISHINQFFTYLKTTGLHSSSIECYCRDINHFITWLMMEKHHSNIEGPEEIESYMDYLQQTKMITINSRRRKTMAVKKFFLFIKAKIYPNLTNPSEKIIIPRRDESLPDLLDHQQISDLLQAAEKSSSFWFKSARDPLIITLFCFEGLKIQEIINLRFLDINSSTDQGYIITITGSRKRSIIISKDTANYLHKYLKLLIEKNVISTKYLTDVNPLFPRIIGRQSSIDCSSKPMTRHGVKFFLYRLGESVNIHKLNSELLRHYAIDWMISQNLSIEQIKNHLGLHRQGNILKHQLLSINE